MKDLLRFPIELIGRWYGVHLAYLLTVFQTDHEQLSATAFHLYFHRSFSQEGCPHNRIITEQSERTPKSQHVLHHHDVLWVLEGTLGDQTLSPLPPPGLF